MSTRVDVTALAPGHYGVQVREGPVATSHQVVVPAGFLDDLGLGEVDPRSVVVEAFEFLLDREPASAIRGDFPIDQIAQRYPDFFDELVARLS